MRQLAESIEIADALAGVDVPQQEFLRLLGYPRAWVLDGRARELADWARDWYAKNGRPWFYARQAECLEFASDETALQPDLIKIDGVAFNSKRLHSAFQQAGAHSAVQLPWALDRKPRKKPAGSGRKRSRTSISSSRCTPPPPSPRPASAYSRR